MPDLVRAAVGVFIAALASAGTAVTVMTLPPLVMKIAEDGWSGAIAALLVFPLIGVPMAAFIFMFAVVPALVFHIMAEARGWRHPILYIIVGGIVGLGLMLTTNLFTSPDAGDRMLGYVVAASGLIGGWVFWRSVVHPLRAAAVSIRSFT